MPELPEVETTCRGISPHICNQQVSKVVIRQPALRWPIPNNIQSLLEGNKVISVSRRGKYILISFAQGTAMIHLGMSGSLRILHEAVDIRKHDHFDIEFSNQKILRYNDPRRFGAFLWAGEDLEQHKLIANLGVEPLEEDFDLDYLYRASRKRSLAVKQFIMDGHLVVGVGNIYANESLFQAGIRPTTPANKVSKASYKVLVKVIKEVLTKAISQGGTTLKDFTQVDGKPGYFSQQLNVYGRGGEKCHNCESILLELRQGGRASVYCKQCQH